MKLHLEARVTLSNVPPKINPIKTESYFIYYSTPNIVICDINSLKVLHKFKYEEIQIIKIHNNHLYICTSNIYTLDLINFEIIDVLKLSKAQITKIIFFKEFILLSKIDNKITLFCNKRKIYEVKNDNFCEGVFIGENYSGFYDCGNTKVYSSRGLMIAHHTSDQIVGVHSFDNYVYVLEASGSLIELLSNTVVETNMEISSCYFTRTNIYAINGNRLVTMSYNGNIIESLDLNLETENYSGNVFDYYSTVKNELNTHISPIKHEKRLKPNSLIDVEQSDDDTEDCYSENVENSNNSINAEGDSKSEENSYNSSNNEGNEESAENTSSSTNGEDEYSASDNVTHHCSEENSGVSIADEYISNDRVEYNKNFDKSTPQYERNFDCDDALDDEDNASEITTVEFFIVEAGLIKTSENDYIFVDNNKINRILVFADDLTDSCNFQNNVILSTSSGYLKYFNICKYTAGEYLSDSKILRVHNSAITCIKLYKNMLVTGSEDKTICFFEIDLVQDQLKFIKVYEIKGFTSIITSLVYENNILACSTRDNILQIFRSQELFPEQLISTDNKAQSYKQYSDFYNSFENVSTQKPHLKQISHLSLTPKFIITSSSDKSSKTIDFNGTTVKTINSEKVICSSFDTKYIAICSHKGAKILHSSTLSLITTFQSRNPILTSCFYKGYFLALSDVLRVYDVDKKKCIKSYDLGLKNCWNFTFPIACGENQTVVLEDISDETYNKLVSTIRSQKESTILFDKYVREKDFALALDVLLKKDNDTPILKLISDGFNFDKNLTFLSEFMKNGDIKNRIFDIYLKNSGFKGSEIFNKITSQFSEGKIDKQKKEKIIKIVQKHCEAIDNVFIELLSLKIFNK